MDDSCQKIREQIPELIGASLSAEKAVELEQHRNQCPACNEYFEALQADDKLLCELSQAMQPSVVRLKNIAMDELGRRWSGKRAGPVPMWTRIAKSRMAGIAAAVLIVAAVLIGAAMFGGSGEEPAETVRQVNEPDQGLLDLPNENKPDLDAVIAAELGRIREMFATSDIAGLVAMLSAGQPQSKIATASYLAQIGDVQALGALEQLSAEWKGDAADNPFARAVAQIMSRLGQQEQEREAGEEENETSVAETTTGESEEEVGCRGVVVDEQGRAVPDARILFYHNRSRWGLGNRILEETVTTDDGTFVCKHTVEFSSVKEHSYAQDTYILMATHPDYAFGWRIITPGSKQASYRVVLTSPTSRTITVTDHDGNPLAGARVWPYSAGSRESPNAVFRDYLTLATDVGLAGGTTDTEGQAVVSNLPDTACSFRATLKGYAEGLAFSAKATIRLSKGASISGWVLAEGDKPVAGAIVSFATNWMHHYFLAVSDNEGYFHIEDLPAQGWGSGAWGDPSGSYTVTIKHGQCAAPPTEVTLLPGQSIDDFLLEASSDTTLVECRVVEFGTDVPVAGALIRGVNRIGKFSGYSDSEGVFAVRVLSGLVRLSFRSPPNGVYVLNERKPAGSLLDFDAIGEKMTVTLKTPPIAGFLRSVPGIVLGPDGMSHGEGETMVYAAAQKVGAVTTSNRVGPVAVDGDGHFELKDVAAGCRLNLYVATKDLVLAGVDSFEIPDDADWQGYLAVNLRATQSAAVIVSDDDGNVVRDGRLIIAPAVEGERILSADQRGRTDGNGLLELDGIVPGLEYYLISTEPTEPDNRSPYASRRRVAAGLKMVLIPLESQ